MMGRLDVTLLNIQQLSCIATHTCTIHNTFFIQESQKPLEMEIMRLALYMYLLWHCMNVNCEEQLPKQPIGPTGFGPTGFGPNTDQQSAECWSVFWQQVSKLSVACNTYLNVVSPYSTPHI